MPHPPHIEQHFTASETVRDIVIEMSDGRTVPSALASGAAFQIVRAVAQRGKNLVMECANRSRSLAPRN
jgi:hypothetical protein